MNAFKQTVAIKKLLFSDRRHKQNEYFNSPIFYLSVAVKKQNFCEHIYRLPPT